MSESVKTKHKAYKIPHLPFGWGISAMSFTLCDQTTVEEAYKKDDDTVIRELHIELEDGGGGNFIKMKLKDGYGNDVSDIDMDAETLISIGKFCESIVNMVDNSYKDALEESERVVS